MVCSTFFSRAETHHLLSQFLQPHWLRRGWAKGKGVSNHLSFQVINSTRVATLNELAKLKMSILHTCTEKKVLLLYMAHGFYTKTLNLTTAKGATTTQNEYSIG